MNRRAILSSGIVLAAAAPAVIACTAGPNAAPGPTPTTQQAARPAFLTQVQLVPQEPRAGEHEFVVIRVLFRNAQGGRPVSGAVLSAIVNYPSGPKTFTSEVSTFPDGRTELAVPVAPATRGQQVRIEVIMRYQGQEYRSNSGFTVR